MGKLRRSARLSAARSGKVSTSRASCSTSQAEHLPRDHFQARIQKLSKDTMPTETQSQRGHTRVLRNISHGNVPSKSSSVACLSMSATKTTRSPVLAKHVYRRNTDRNAVDMKQRKHYEHSENMNFKVARSHVCQGHQGNNQASSSKSQTKSSAHSASVHYSERSPEAQVSTCADKTAGATANDLIDWKEFRAEVDASREFSYMIISSGNENLRKLMRDHYNWNLNWSCSLMTHDTNVPHKGWLPYSFM
ncbi:hypothetical protein BsWGS_20921 [Bradybaena similaris]